LHFSPIGKTTPHEQLFGTGGHVGAAVVVVGATVGAFVVQLILHLLHFSPIGNTTPHGQFVGTGGHVGECVVVCIVVVGVLVVQILHTEHPVLVLLFKLCTPQGH
jgi:heme/copper-type cytochrome/quinol oxidase subunit 4